MTNKYSGLSDVEIDYLVAEKRNLIVIDHTYRNEYFPKICSSYEDAFKLMIDNEINLIKGKNSWLAEDGERLGTNNKNPCRAIAECFLLMKDAENE